MQTQRIVIVGAGFGGLYTFRRLQHRYAKQPRVKLTLVNPENYFLFTPLLHEVATGGVSPQNAVEPIRKVTGCCGTDFVLAAAERISFKHKHVLTKFGQLPYDTLVLAPGAETNFYDVDGAAKYAFELKTLNDAVRLKNHFIDLFEQAAQLSPQALSPLRPSRSKEKLLSFVVVGGGPTGVELAAEMSDFFYDTLARYYPTETVMRHVQITLVESGAELISQFSPPLRQKALETLRRKQIDVRLGTRVTSVTSQAAVLSTGENIPTATTIWVAGVKPKRIPSDLPLKQDTCERVMVDQFLRLPGQADVYILGDAALCLDGQRPLPATAQTATQQAKTVAENIIRAIEGRPLQPLLYKHRGNLISLGQWMALAEISNFNFWGRVTWWLWRTVYLSKFISWNKKIDVALDWTLSIFAHRDMSRLVYEADQPQSSRE